MRPDQFGFSPEMARSTVDLPDPDSPTMPKLPPPGTAKLTSFTTSLLPKLMRNPSTVIMRRSRTDRARVWPSGLADE